MPHAADFLLQDPRQPEDRLFPEAGQGGEPSQIQYYTVGLYQGNL